MRNTKIKDMWCNFSWIGRVRVQFTSMAFLWVIILATLNQSYIMKERLDNVIKWRTS